MTNILSIQIEPEIGKRDVNHKKASAIVEQYAHKKPDLIIMPEFFNTGINKDAFKLLAEEEVQSPTVNFFKELAIKYNSYILCGSIVEKDGNSLYNASMLLNKKGEMVAKYRKMNLFKYFGGTENEYITAGSEFVVVDTEIGKIGLSVCFDIAYPRHFIELAKKGAQIILCPAAWCTMADEKSIQIATNNWNSWNVARAVENGVYFVSANLCGNVKDTSLYCTGNSSIISYDGEILARAGQSEGAVFAQIDVSKVDAYKKNAAGHFE